LPGNGNPRTFRSTGGFWFACARIETLSVSMPPGPPFTLNPKAVLLPLAVAAIQACPTHSDIFLIVTAGPMLLLHRATTAWTLLRFGYDDRVHSGFHRRRSIPVRDELQERRNRGVAERGVNIGLDFVELPGLSRFEGNLQDAFLSVV